MKYDNEKLDILGKEKDEVSLYLKNMDEEERLSIPYDRIIRLTKIPNSQQVSPYMTNWIITRLHPDWVSVSGNKNKGDWRAADGKIHETKFSRITVINDKVNALQIRTDQNNDFYDFFVIDELDDNKLFTLRLTDSECRREIVKQGNQNTHRTKKVNKDTEAVGGKGAGKTLRFNWKRDKHRFEEIDVNNIPEHVFEQLPIKRKVRKAHKIKTTLGELIVEKGIEK